MKLKKIVARLLIIVGMVSLLGGCGMSKETLTKEQQDNVVKRIVRQYRIESIEFTEFVKDRKTGTYLLNLKINNNLEFQTTLPFRNIDRLDNSTDDIGLNPVDSFILLERMTPLEDESINIKNIKIIYLGE
ncbi:hypothetical protein [Streptococcus fryi]